MKNLITILKIVFLSSFVIAIAFVSAKELKYQHLFNSFDGTFVLYDLNKNEFSFINKSRSSKRTSPCSTFKIPNALIGLETGVLDGPEDVMKWDGMKRILKSHNQVHTLRTAMRDSVVWYFQEIARKVGPARYREYLKKLNYGNQDISGGIDKFWLNTSLKISPLEQIEFLKNLYLEKIPFSARSIKIVKEITTLKRTKKYELHGKTGSRWGENKEPALGWFVGYVTKGKNVYIFAMNIEGRLPTFGGLFARELTEKILKSEGIIDTVWSAPKPEEMIDPAFKVPKFK